MLASSEPVKGSVIGPESVQIETSDVIRLVEQFLKEQGLQNSLNALQKESGVVLNTVDALEPLECAAREGRWDEVLSQTSTLCLRRETAMILHEQVVLELLESGESEVVTELLLGAAAAAAPTAAAVKTSAAATSAVNGGTLGADLRVSDQPPLAQLQTYAPARFARLQHLSQRLSTHGELPTAAALYSTTSASKQGRRDALADALRQEITVAPPSRLITLLQQALRWQRHTGALPPGAKHDIFAGKTVASRRDATERHPRKQCGQLKFGKKCAAECAAFSPDGAHLVTGSTDGFVEVWNPETGKLRKEAPFDYQAREAMMMHDDAVLSVAFSADAELLCSGSRDGAIKVWQLQTGICQHELGGTTGQPIASLCFSRDNSAVLSAGFDRVIRLHGLRSGTILKQFRGHESFVDSVAFTHNERFVLSGSSDGTVRVWSVSSAECVQSFRPPAARAAASAAAGEAGLLDAQIHTVLPMPGDGEQIVVCSRSHTAHLFTLSGKLLRDFSVASEAFQCSFVSCELSPQGHWLYCVGDNHMLYCFIVATGDMVHSMQLHERDVLGLAHHPHRNLLVSHARDGLLKLWRASASSSKSKRHKH